MWVIQNRWINLIFLLFAFFSEKVFAEDYALVIGGSSKKVESKQQEFARITAAATIGLEAKGYKVTTLFGSGRDDEERKKYPADFEKIGGLQTNNALGTSRAATASNIDSVFETLVAKAKAGDRIEILLSAHGSDTCGELGQQIRNDIGSQCQHTFTVLTLKGAKPNIQLKKCSSI